MRNNDKQQMQLAPVAIGQELDIHSIVIAFEQCGGNLSAFLKQLPISSSFENKQTFLCRLYRLLDMPNNELFKQRWKTALAISKRVRLDLLQDKALGKLESYENKSETSSTADIAYAKLLLPEIKAKNEQEVEQNEMSEHEREANECYAALQEQWDKEEQESTAADEDKQYQEQYNPPRCFPPARSAEDDEMAKVEKRLAITQRNLISADEFNRINKNRVSITGLPLDAGMLC